MNTEAIRQQLQDFVRFADDDQLQAILALVKRDFLPQDEWWEQENVIDEPDSRSIARREGIDAGMSWEEVKQKLEDRGKWV